MEKPEAADSHFNARGFPVARQVTRRARPHSFLPDTDSPFFIFFPPNVFIDCFPNPPEDCDPPPVEMPVAEDTCDPNLGSVFTETADTIPGEILIMRCWEFFDVCGNSVDSCQTIVIIGMPSLLPFTEENEIELELSNQSVVQRNNSIFESIIRKSSFWQDFGVSEDWLPVESEYIEPGTPIYGQLNFSPLNRLRVLLGGGYTYANQWSIFEVKGQEVFSGSALDIWSSSGEVRWQPLKFDPFFIRAGLQMNRIQSDWVFLQFQGYREYLYPEKAEWFAQKYVGVGLRFPLEQFGLLEINGNYLHTRINSGPQIGFNYKFNFGNNGKLPLMNILRKKDFK